MAENPPSLPSSEAEALYRFVVSTMDEGFCVIEMKFDGGRPRDYVFLEINPAFESQTGLENVVGRSMRELAPTHEEHWFEMYGRVALTGEPVRFQHQAGALGRFFEVHAFPLGAPHENKVAVLFKDITQQHQLLEQLRESDRRKDEFLAVLGHELRNPLAAITSAAQIIRLSRSDDADLQRTQAVIERQATQMTGLIDGLLEVSRIVRGKVELEKEVFDLRRLIEELVHDRIARIESLGLRIETECSSPLWVLGDRVRLTQVFDNLLGNAMKFTHGDGTITVRARCTGSDVVVAVRDTGVGIPAEVLGRLFEPFQQGGARSKQGGGLGLGLAVARGIVELHGGRITARSDGPGRGAELEVTLPEHSAAITESPGAPEDRDTLRRILIAEDNMDAAETLRDLLEVLGHSVAVAGTAAAALRHLRESQVDVVLCDIGLPGMSGYELAMAVRSDPRFGSVRLVAITGYGQPGDRQRSLDAGFDEHLTKPVDLTELRGLIEIEAPRATTSPAM